MFENFYVFGDSLVQKVLKFSLNCVFGFLNCFKRARFQLLAEFLYADLKVLIFLFIVLKAEPIKIRTNLPCPKIR